jgi:GAF domain-containing protein
MTGISEKSKKYDLLLKQIEQLISDKDPLITNLSNFVAAVKETFPEISWAGFYLAKNKVLFLGPFQGKVACTKIKFGDGVCGYAAENRIAQVVDDVHQYPGHIACDVESNSEIVIPIEINKQVFGVLDLDSTKFAYFDENDRISLEKLIEVLKRKLNFENHSLI